MDLKSLLSAGMGEMRPTQHPVGRISNIEIKYHTSNHQLHFTSLCSSSENPNRKYQGHIIFNQVIHSDKSSRETPLRYHEPMQTLFLSLPTSESSVQVRCSCLDNYYMWQYQNKNAGALIGRYKPYIKKTDRPYRNTLNVPGVCKHLLYLIKILGENRLVLLEPEISRFVTKSLVSIR